MGIRASLTEITPDIYEQVCAGLEPKFPESPHYYFIDKAWHDFHAVLRDKGMPLSLAIAGDCLHPQSSHALDEFCEGNHDYYLGFVSPNLVQLISQSITAVTPSDYAGWEGEFAQLQAAYLDAAARKNALVVVIS
jgi:hypothetical protein